LFDACAPAALRSTVEEGQLATAVSVQQGRLAAVGLGGPPLGGVLISIARFVRSRPTQPRTALRTRDAAQATDNRNLTPDPLA
jgi:hypothetical protein